jgi:hypothetical protein
MEKRIVESSTGTQEMSYLTLRSPLRNENRDVRSTDLRRDPR